MTPDPRSLSRRVAAQFGVPQQAVGHPDDAETIATIARFARVVAARLDAGRAACRFVAAAGHDGRHRSCRACGVLRDAQVAGLWTPEPSGPVPRRPDPTKETI